MQPTVDQLIYLGLSTLVTNDNYLLKNNLNERTITHKLAEYYQQIFPEWNVDCEFNRNLDGPKDIYIDPKEILRQMADKVKGFKYLEKFIHDEDEYYTDEDLGYLESQLRKPKFASNEELDVILYVLKLKNDKELLKTVYPDIIIHQRGTVNNHVVLEVKKSVNTDRIARLYDLVKLMTLVSSPDFHYQRGYFVDIPIADDLARFEKFNSLVEFVKKVYKITPKYS